MAVAHLHVMTFQEQMYRSVHLLRQAKCHPTRLVKSKSQPKRPCGVHIDWLITGFILQVIAGNIKSASQAYKLIFTFPVFCFGKGKHSQSILILANIAIT